MRSLNTKKDLSSINEILHSDSTFISFFGFLGFFGFSTCFNY